MTSAASPTGPVRRARPRVGGAVGCRTGGRAGADPEGDVATATGRTVALGVLGVLALAGCGAGDPGGTSAGRPDAPVTGTVMILSDVSDLPDVPDPDGWVVAFPAARIADVMALAGDDPTEGDLPYSWFDMSVETAQRLGGTVGEVDGTGRFTLDASGDALVCRLVTERGSGAQGARGCVRTALPAGGVVRVSNGEAGLRVAEVADG